MILVRIILAYQNSAFINRLVRGVVRLHHSPVGLSGCPLAGSCSAAGLAAAQSQGWGALGPILRRMRMCGGTDVSSRCG